MNTCPHCGADLRDGARFCPHCMTPLNEKRVISAPKYILRRWLSATVAIFVFVLGLYGVRTIPKNHLPLTPPTQDEMASTSSTPISTTVPISATVSDTTTMSVNNTTTLTTLAEVFTTSMESAAESTATTKKPISYPTYATIPTAPKITTGSTASRTTTASTSTTTTTKKTTTTTATTTTRPYWSDATPAAVTEDGLPIEEVTWLYEPIPYSPLSLSRCRNNYPNSSYSAIDISETPSGVPLNQCIQVTGCVGATSNGIYRVPATIDGKVVACVDFNDSFSDSEVALSVKRIYLPPDTVAFFGGIQQCTNLEALYFTAPKTWFYHKSLPPQTPSWYGGVKQYDLIIYTPGSFYPTFVWNLTPPVFMYACNGSIYDAKSALLTKEQCRLLYGNPQ